MFKKNLVTTSETKDNAETDFKIHGEKKGNSLLIMISKYHSACFKEHKIRFV